MVDLKLAKFESNARNDTSSDTRNDARKDATNNDLGHWLHIGALLLVIVLVGGCGKLKTGTQNDLSGSAALNSLSTAQPSIPATDSTNASQTPSDAPIGFVEGLEKDAETGKITVHGWACVYGDPGSITVEAIVDGSSSWTTAKIVREKGVSDVCGTESSNYGFSIDITSASPHRGAPVSVRGISRVGRWAELKNSRNFYVPNTFGKGDITGYVDAMDLDSLTGKLTVRGWACVNGNLAPLKIHVNIEGQELVATANLKRENGVRDSCGTGASDYGFSVDVSSLAAGHVGMPVFVSAFTETFGYFELGYSGTFYIPTTFEKRKITGYVDALELEPATGHLTVRGWTCVIGEPSSIKVVIWVGKPDFTLAGSQRPQIVRTADIQREKGVADGCGTNFSKYGFSIDITDIGKGHEGVPVLVWGYEPTLGISELGFSGSYSIPK